MYPIEKHIPPPCAHHRTRYPFRDMEVGDSFYVPRRDHERPCGTASRVKAAIYKLRCRDDRTGRFCTRRDPDGVRVWRIA